MSVVYEALDLELNRPVAIKVLRTPCLTTEREREPWRNEAQTLARTHHPNIVRLYDADEADGRLYFVLELLTAGSLADQIRSVNPPCLPTVARWIEDVARAIDHMHRLDVLHLDLKPSNILLDSTLGPSSDLWIPKVSDFGLARLMEGGEATASRPVGSPPYSAPEQLQSTPSKIGRRTDVYGLGATLYHAITGQPPFLGDPIAVIDQVRNEDPIAPRRLVTALPRDLETICLTCLDKKPERRYATALELAEDLRRWREGEPIQAQPTSPLAKMLRWCGRNQLVAGLIALLVLLTFGSLLCLAVLLQRSETARLNAEASNRHALHSLSRLSGLVHRTLLRSTELDEEMLVNDALTTPEDLTATIANSPESLEQVLIVARKENYVASLLQKKGESDVAFAVMDSLRNFLLPYWQSEAHRARMCHAWIELLSRRSYGYRVLGDLPTSEALLLEALRSNIWNEPSANRGDTAGIVVSQVMDIASLHQLQGRDQNVHDLFQRTAGQLVSSLRGQDDEGALRVVYAVARALADPSPSNEKRARDLVQIERNWQEPGVIDCLLKWSIRDLILAEQEWGKNPGASSPSMNNWAERTAALIRSRLEELRLPLHLEATIESELFEVVAQSGTILRRRRQYAAAEEQVQRLSTLVESASQRHPQNARSFITLARLREQEAKNHWAQLRLEETVSSLDRGITLLEHARKSGTDGSEIAALMRTLEKKRQNALGELRQTGQ